MPVRAFCVLAWVGLASVLGLAILSFLNIAGLEFGPLAHRALSVDETYFGACAARGNAVGEFPSAGCHDNKAPLIFALYQLLQLRAPYDLFAIKGAASLTAATIAVLSGWIAYRLGGTAAALVAPALILQVLTADADLLAFKTEEVGAVFMLVGLLMLLSTNAPWRRPGMLFGAGLFFGLAVITKQTYAFAAIAVILWIAFLTRGGIAAWAASATVRVGAFSLGVLVPFLLFWGIFHGQGRQADFLSSFLLYPAVYGGSGGAGFRTLIWKLAAFLDHTSNSPSLFVLFAAGVILHTGEGIRNAADGSSSAAARLLLLSVSFLLLVMALVSPISFSYHHLPAWVAMAVVGGVVVGDCWPNFAPRVVAAFAVGLVAAALLVAQLSWRSNGGRGNLDDLLAAVEPRTGNRGEFAYVLGTWPSFYFYNGMIPASNIQFPWALPGMPRTWHSSPPDPDSFRGRLLMQVQKRNLINLLADFRRTPPAYILVVEQMARQQGSNRITDVPELAEYLRENCTYSHSISEPRRGDGMVYQCRVR